MSNVDVKDFDPATFDGPILTRERTLCPIHGEPFREKWPAGWPIFSVRAFQELTGIDGIWEEARRRAGLAEGTDVPPKAMELVLDARPACCRFSPQRLLALYEEAKIGVVRRCKMCGVKRLGTPYKATNAPIGGWSHVCFLCVVHASATPQEQS